MITSISSTQLLILIIISLIFAYAIIDRICRCVEIAKNPLSGFENVMKFIKGMNEGINENGDKPV